MSKTGGYRFLGLLTLILLAGVVAIAFLTKPGGIVASGDTTSLNNKIVLMSQVVRAARIHPPYRKNPVYRIVAEYRFHNPGDECSVRFDIPGGYIESSYPQEGAEIFEDGNPVDVSTIESGKSATVGLPGSDRSWRTVFKEGEVKEIVLKYYLEPVTEDFWGTLEWDGRDMAMTKASHIFPSTVEKFGLPVGLGAASIEGTCSLEVEIDTGFHFPPGLIMGDPGSYRYQNGKLIWQSDASRYKDVFRIGIIRVADGLFDIDDAREVVRALTDLSYIGYIKGLSDDERKALLRIARNGVFAKYGFQFKKYLSTYFRSLAWYEPNPGYSDVMLTEEDLAIVRMILEAEGSI